MFRSFTAAHRCFYFGLLLMLIGGIWSTAPAGGAWAWLIVAGAVLAVTARLWQSYLRWLISRPQREFGPGSYSLELLIGPRFRSNRRSAA